ncbi:MAG: histidine phosphatase family protein [Candidatus Aphodocola sp.]
MNLILLRHGEATDNVKELISDKEIYWSVLTEKGKETVMESINYLPININKVYVSPLPRTIQTANYVYEKYPNVEFIIEDRIREIKYGKYTHKKNNEELDEVRNKQIKGDYFTRFGGYGENKYDIELRLSEFLIDIYINHKDDETILIVTHGSISSYIKRILKVKSSHLQTGKLEVFNDIDFEPVFKNIELLNMIK